MHHEGEGGRIRVKEGRMDGEGTQCEKQQNLINTVNAGHSGQEIQDSGETGGF